MNGLYSAGGSGDGALKKTLLWENSSKTSCSAQTLTFENLQDFDFVEVEYNEKSTSTETMSVIFSAKQAFGNYLNNAGNTANSTAVRWIVRKSKTSILIGNAYSSRSATSTSNSFLVPVYIYGIKGKIK